MLIYNQGERNDPYRNTKASESNHPLITQVRRLQIVDGVVRLDGEVIYNLEKVLKEKFK